MNNYLNNIMPDSISGEILAAESLIDGITLLNGPSGCKFYHGATSGYQLRFTNGYNPLDMPDEWYCGQPRVPCTFMDTRDYVYGSEEKLVEVLSALIALKPRPSFVAVINSPGAALIGDDLNHIVKNIVPEDIPVYIVQSPGFSQPFSSSYDQAICEIICLLNKSIEEVRPIHKKYPRVNLLGLSLLHRNREGDKQELERLLKLCGIEINCCLGFDMKTEQIRHLHEVELNIVLCPEYAMKTAQLLEKLNGTPYYCPALPPIGFAATEQFIRDICNRLNLKVPESFTEECNHSRATAYGHIRHMHTLSGLPTGISFAVEGTWSQAAGYAAFISGYLGMEIRAVNILDPEVECGLQLLPDALTEIGFFTAAKRDIIHANAQIALASGITIARLTQQQRPNQYFSGIEIGLPTMGYIDVIPKTHLGLQGALQLCELLLNAMPF